VGLVIHETQLSFEEEGIQKILDVGEWWDKESGGLPVPLGVNVMNEELGPELINKFDLYLQESIKFARNNIKDGIDYAMKYSRGKSRELIEKFVLMYVNEVTVDMGEPGEKAVKLMFKMAKEKGLVPEFELKISKPL